MTDNDEVRAGGLDVQLAQELIERARAEGVSLVGPDGLLAGGDPDGVAGRDE